MEDINERPTLDEVAEDWDESKARKLSPEEIEELREENPITEPQGAVCARITDGRVICIDCLETNKWEHPEGSPFFILMTQAFRFFYPEISPVCANCEVIIRVEDAHFCEEEEDILRYIEWDIKDGFTGELTPEQLKEVTPMMFRDLIEKGVYTECKYHKDHVIIKFPEKGIEDGHGGN